MKKKIHPLVKIQEKTLKAGLEWIAKVQLRCALEGCRYGNEVLDKEPLDKCMYCGEPRNYYFGIDSKNIGNIQKSLKKTRPKLI